MNKVYFKYKEHPGDLFRSSGITKLPNVENETEEFLVQFLPCYQTDNNVTYYDDLHKLLNNEFPEQEYQEFIDFVGGNKTKEEILLEIEKTEKELINKAYRNFYSLVLDNKIVIYNNGEK